MIAVTLVYLKWQEGRMTLFGFKSKTLQEREARGSLSAPQEKRPELATRSSSSDLTKKHSSEGSDSAGSAGDDAHDMIPTLGAPVRA